MFIVKNKVVYPRMFYSKLNPDKNHSVLGLISMISTLGNNKPVIDIIIKEENSKIDTHNTVGHMLVEKPANKDTNTTVSNPVGDAIAVVNAVADAIQCLNL